MGKWRRRRLIIKTTKLFLILYIIVLFTSSSCAASNAKNYPLSVDDGGSGEVGNQLNKAGDSWVFGILFIKNIGKTPITITHVALTDETNMTMKEALLREATNGLIGVARWPLDINEHYPMADYSAADEWLDAEGAIIEPGDGFNLIIVVDSQEDVASASGLKIEYKDANQKKYVQNSNYAYYLSSEGLE